MLVGPTSGEEILYAVADALEGSDRMLGTVNSLAASGMLNIPKAEMLMMSFHCCPMGHTVTCLENGVFDAFYFIKCMNEKS